MLPRRFRRRTVEVTATRWVKFGDHPAVKPHTVQDEEFRRQTGYGLLETPDGTVKVMPGDWILRFEDGRLARMAEKDFFELYERIDEHTN